MRSRSRVALWAAAVGYAVAIFVLSSQPVPGPAREALAEVGDKALHVTEYVGFAFLLALAVSTAPSPAVRLRAAPIALVAAIIYAATDELHQTFVPGREGDVTDFAADAIGAAIAAIVYQVWQWRAWRARLASETSPR